jgi:hypothetical protein
MISFCDQLYSINFLKLLRFLLVFLHYKPLKNTNNCGWLGSSLGEATINLYMKFRVEDIHIISK